MDKYRSFESQRLYMIATQKAPESMFMQANRRYYKMVDGRLDGLYNDYLFTNKMF